MRLIDADELLKNGFHLEKDEEKGGITVTTIVPIEDIPTAYDVDKIVEEIEKLKLQNFSTDNIFYQGVKNGVNTTVTNVIDIVKRGGIDG